MKSGFARQAHSFFFVFVLSWIVSASILVHGAWKSYHTENDAPPQYRITDIWALVFGLLPTFWLCSRILRDDFNIREELDIPLFPRIFLCAVVASGQVVGAFTVWLSNRADRRRKTSAFGWDSFSIILGAQYGLLLLGVFTFLNIIPLIGPIGFAIFLNRALARPDKASKK